MGKHTNKLISLAQMAADKYDSSDEDLQSDLAEAKKALSDPFGLENEPATSEKEYNGAHMRILHILSKMSAPMLELQTTLRVRPDLKNSDQMLYNSAVDFIKKYIEINNQLTK